MCWLWSLSPAGRKQLRSLRFRGQGIPVLLSARVLGADVAYCYRRAAKVRNTRVRQCHARFLRIRALPVSRVLRTQLVLRGAFPAALHAAEATVMPVSTFRRLRTQAVKAVGLSGSGVNPWLAASVGASQVVDPQWVVLLSRIRLYRQIRRDFPGYGHISLECLERSRGRFQGTTRQLVRTLGALGWSRRMQETFVDCQGRSFDLRLSSILHIETLLLSTWADHVVQRVAMRKGLEGLESLDIEASRPSRSLLPSEQALLAQLVVGRHFTADATKHFSAGDGTCPLCGLDPDNRPHRVYHCAALEQLRKRDPLLAQCLREVPQVTACFGLWPEIEGLRVWQAELDAHECVTVERCRVQQAALLFTDGSRLFPQDSVLHWGASAVVELDDVHGFRIAFSGFLPTSQQSVPRAEIYAGLVAVQLYTRFVLFSDCLHFVRKASLWR